KLPDRVVRYTPESIFLFALELSRQAQELLSSNGSRPRSLELGGAAPSVPLGDELLPAMFQLGLDLAFAVENRNGAQRETPCCREGVERCQPALRAPKSRPPPPPPATEGPAPDRRKRSTPALEERGRLHRLKFVQRYEVRVSSPDTTAHVLPIAQGRVWIA